MKTIVQPIALALALGVGASSAALAGDNAAAPEDTPMQNLRDDRYYGGEVYVAPANQPYRYRYGYYDRYYYGHPYERPYYRHHHHRPLFGLHVPFVGLHLG